MHINVLHSVSASTDSSNPFVSLLVDNLPDSVDSRYFSWSAALFGKYDVLHVQWPERFVQGGSGAKRMAKRALLALLLTRLRLTKRAMVLTLHNLDAHEGTSPAERRRLDRIYSQATVFVALNGDEAWRQVVDRQPVVIPHGDYSQVYHRDDLIAPAKERLLFFGLVRAYKNVPELIESFRTARSARPELTLSVLGLPRDAEIAEHVKLAAANDPSVELDLRDVPSAELVSAISRAGLIVLPYRKLYNSGAVFAALTLHRPVLLPRTSTTEALQEEFGAAWILLYDGDLTSNHLEAASDAVRDGRVGVGAPDLSTRDWRRIGARYAEVYEHALRLAREQRKASAS